jgi:hypothetical protein
VVDAQVTTTARHPINGVSLCSDGQTIDLSFSQSRPLSTPTTPRRNNLKQTARSFMGAVAFRKHKGGDHSGLVLPPCLVLIPCRGPLSRHSTLIVAELAIFLPPASFGTSHAADGFGELCCMQLIGTCLDTCLCVCGCRRWHCSWSAVSGSPAPAAPGCSTQCIEHKTRCTDISGQGKQISINLAEARAAAILPMCRCRAGRALLHRWRRSDADQWPLYKHMEHIRSGIGQKQTVQRCPPSGCHKQSSCHCDGQPAAHGRWPFRLRCALPQTASVLQGLQRTAVTDAAVICFSSPVACSGSPLKRLLASLRCCICRFLHMRLPLHLRC